MTITSEIRSLKLPYLQESRSFPLYYVPGNLIEFYNAHLCVSINSIMNNTLYMKGDPGFKPAILTKLGGTWLHGFEDCDENVLGFSIPENVLLEDFKKAIGYNNITSFNLLFFDTLPGDSASNSPVKFIPGTPIKMSIWANKNYNLTRDN
jgi:hypothetical protein